MNDRYRRDHGYRDYGYDDHYGSIEQREDLGESPFRRGRSNDDRGQERSFQPRRGPEQRFGSEDRDERGSPRYGQRFGNEGRTEPRYGGSEYGSEQRRSEYGFQGDRDQSMTHRNDDWDRSPRSTREYGGGMGSTRDPWPRSGSNYGPRYGQGSSQGQGQYENTRNQEMGSWARDGSWRQSGWSSDATAGARSGGFAGRGPKGYTRSDDRIREDICDRLSDDDDLDASEISVTVMNGEVTLEGNVTDRRSKHRAEDIADAVSGVQDVHNRLRTRKTFFQEVGDRLMGRDEAEQHGHHGSGTRNTPPTSGTSTGTSTTVKNGVTEPNRSM